MILASIDMARKQAYLHGDKIFDRLIRIANKARKRISKCQNIYTFGREDMLERGFDLDPTKLTVNVTKTGLSGHKIEHILTEEYSVQVDCADLFNIIAIMGTGTEKQDVEKLVNALEEIDTKYYGDEKNYTLQIPSLTTEMVMMPRDVFFKYKSKRVSLSKAAGHISAQTLTPYPPGIPVLIPGERITSEICEYITGLSTKEIRISGQETDTLKTIKVVSLK